MTKNPKTYLLLLITVISMFDLSACESTGTKSLKSENTEPAKSEPAKCYFLEGTGSVKEINTPEEVYSILAQAESGDSVA